MFMNIIWRPLVVTSGTVRARIVPCVPTPTKAGVSITPFGVKIRPTRAKLPGRLDWWRTSNRKACRVAAMLLGAPAQGWGQTLFTVLTQESDRLTESQTRGCDASGGGEDEQLSHSWGSIRVCGYTISGCTLDWLEMSDAGVMCEQWISDFMERNKKKDTTWRLSLINHTCHRVNFTEF